MAPTMGDQPWSTLHPAWEVAQAARVPGGSGGRGVEREAEAEGRAPIGRVGGPGLTPVLGGDAGHQGLSAVAAGHSEQVSAPLDGRPDQGSDVDDG